MKRMQHLWLFSVLLAVFLFTGCQNEAQPVVSEVPPALKQAVIAALLADTTGYAEGECSAEGHVILGYEDDAEKTTVYVVTTVAEYGFENDLFIPVSGSGAIPAVMVFDHTESTYSNGRIQYPEDGEGYMESLKKMFPEPYYKQLDQVSDDQLQTQLQEYAKQYLKSIGREAKIADRSGLSYLLLTDEGIEVDVSNALLEQFPEYPYWIGTLERLENKQRYVYEVKLESQKHQIVYTKYHYDTKQIVEQTTVDAATGQQRDSKNVA